MVIPKQYSVTQFCADLAIGVIIALVSIPISMGYSQVAGLPVVYGLYGSLLPILVFGLLSSSKHFVFGVDAAPAALVGGILAQAKISFESPDAIEIVPAITLFVSLWLAVLFLLKAHRVLKFISQPVMGGFITGIGVTIIFMQLPKLFGGTPGTGEIGALLLHLAKEAALHFNVPSFCLGVGTVALLLVSRRFFPKVPMQPILMFVGAALAYFFPIETYGIKTLPAVSGGLPHFSFPSLLIFEKSAFSSIIVPSFSVALVIFSETLLASSNVAKKQSEKLSAHTEIAVYALCNAAAAISGSCPVNGSVSRTGIATQLGVKSQVMSLSAALSMLFILLFFTGFIAYLPVPVLTGIIIAALIGTFEFSLAHKLKKLDRAEFFIFYAAFFAVLLLGTIYGVIIGVALAMLTFMIRQSKPSVDFLGIVPGKEGFYSLTRRGSVAVPIQKTIIYRFSGPLFYANISQFKDDIENAIKEDTRVFIVDSSGITSIDAPSAEELSLLHKNLQERKVSLYLAGHVSAVNDQLRTFGALGLIRGHAVRLSISAALADAHIIPPYPIDTEAVLRPYSTQVAEFEWAYGSEAEKMMGIIAKKIAHEIAGDIEKTGRFDMEKVIALEKRYSRGYWDAADEDEFLDILEIQIEMLREQGKLDNIPELDSKITARHAALESLILEHNGDFIKSLVARRKARTLRVKEAHPYAFQKLEIQQELFFEELAQNDPLLAKKLARIISEAENKDARL